jgi:hypothetical protein
VGEKTLAGDARLEYEVLLRLLFTLEESELDLRVGKRGAMITMSVRAEQG